MKSMNGPGLFLAQFAGDTPPFDTLDRIAAWAAGLGYGGVQIPSGDKRLFDLSTAAESQAYCDDVRATLERHGLIVTDLSVHLQGKLVAVHPAYDSLLDAFAPPALHGQPAERQAWAERQIEAAAKASARLGLTTLPAFSGSLAWPYFYPFPQRPAGLIEAAFDELARRWRPLLDICDSHGVDVCFELHPGEDLFDGATFERFLAAVDDHPRANLLYDPSHMLLQQLDYLGFIDRYHDRIRAFHVKDAEFQPSASQGVYGGYAGWVERAGRFRSLGDGQIDFGAIFSKLAQYDYDGWAVLEWECALKHPEDGAAEGADFIRRHMIRVAQRAFDDFAGAALTDDQRRDLLGLGRETPGG
ncbi:sugar phosphate isomerase/epimerase [Salinisphaera sp.]|uniref:sugar phosphate isomerase/epimerase family protein n=1 Tax=Salinisphaera sp. TaxID=1914330 RepID=UPI002D79D228|nr:sugar phosphate isomerase/epimerase [Salinisphaera sp.]HET7314631.1 sugar phosphate isomerase/epimerase [Salinisphaera sp.]